MAVNTIDPKIKNEVGSLINNPNYIRPIVAGVNDMNAPKATELAYMSTDLGAGYVQRDQQALDQMSGQTMNIPSTNLAGTSGFNGNTTIPPPSTPYVPPTTTTPTATLGKIKYINFNGQTTELNGSAITPEAVQGLISQGYYSTETSGDVPSWASTGDIAAGRQSAELADAKAKKDALVLGMAKFMVTDEALKGQVDAINGLYDTRIANMQDINKRRTASVATMGLRLGSQYTGGAGGVFGGIVTEEERQGAARITELEAAKQAAISAAKEAARGNNWSIFSKQVDAAQTAYQDQIKAVTEFNKNLVERNKVIAEQLTAMKNTQEMEIKTIDSLGYLALSALQSSDPDSAIKELAGQYGVDANKLFSKAQELSAKDKAWGTPYDMPGIGKVQINIQTGEIRTISPTSTITGGADGTNYSKVLSPDDAIKMDVPYGTTVGQAIAMGKVPEKPATQAEQKVATYAARIEQANPTLSRLQPSIVKMNPIQFETQIKMPSYLQSAEIKQYMQAARNFINATLREESGAVISPTEFAEAYRQYLPRPNDDAKTLQQKADNRQIVYGSFKKAAGNAYQSVEELLGDTGGGVINLKDPKTGIVKSFSGLSKEDLADAIKQGFIKQ